MSTESSCFSLLVFKSQFSQSYRSMESRLEFVGRKGIKNWPGKILMISRQGFHCILCPKAVVVNSARQARIIIYFSIQHAGIGINFTKSMKHMNTA